jgi:hypothetical protein
MTRRAMSLAVLLSITACSTALAGHRNDEEFTSDFAFTDGTLFVPTGGNEYWSLQPGTFLRLVGEDDYEYAVVEITVTGGVRPVVFRDTDGRTLVAITRVIVEREWIDGEIVEISHNYFARRRGTNDIYYFGEDVDIYEDGEIVSHDGAWLAGEDGAQPGLIMPGLWLLGARYYQEIAADAQDRAEHIDMGFDYTTDAGETFHNCVRIIETTPLEPGEESEKIYARGLGLIYDDGIELSAASALSLYAPADERLRSLTTIDE